MEVVHLDDQCAEPNGAPLRMPLSPREVGHVTLRDSTRSPSSAATQPRRATRL